MWNASFKLTLFGCVISICCVWGGLITLIRDNKTFTITDIHSTIYTHNTELKMVKVHINNTKHIAIANIYIPPRDNTSTHYKTTDRTYNTEYSTLQTYHTHTPYTSRSLLSGSHFSLSVEFTKILLEYQRILCYNSYRTSWSGGRIMA